MHNSTAIEGNTLTLLETKAVLEDGVAIVYRRMTDSKSVKKTLSIPSRLNTQAELNGINFSNALQNALMDR